MAPRSRGKPPPGSGITGVSAAWRVRARCPISARPDFRANGGLDQVPGGGDLAADEDLCGIERIDDYRETEPEIAAGFHQCGAGALVASAGSAYDVVHSDAALLEQLPGDGGRKVVPEVAGDRGEVRRVGLEAALRAAQAARAV